MRARPCDFLGFVLLTDSVFVRVSRSACAGDSNVSRKGEDLLRRLKLSMDDAALVQSLMQTFLGQGDQVF